jgi:catechol 2,3-dioxygenase-like lactoylglutathione lyase family enzyme
MSALLGRMSLHHGAVSVPDLESSIDWYRRVLDFELEKRFQIPGEQTEVAMMRLGNVRVELFSACGSRPASPERREPNTDFRTQGNLHFAFAVADVHTVAEELRRRGADIVWIRDFEFGSTAFIRDNAGNLIEFLTQADLRESAVEAT